LFFNTHHEKSNNLDDFFSNVTSMWEATNKFNVSDLIPILKPFYLQGFERKMKQEKKSNKK
jgi:hypothetical protein